MLRMPLLSLRGLVLLLKVFVLCFMFSCSLKVRSYLCLVDI